MLQRRIYGLFEFIRVPTRELRRAAQGPRVVPICGYWRQRADERFGDPPPKGGSRNLQWSETGMEDPQEDPLAVHCFCVCSGSVLLGDLLGVSRSRERDQGTWSVLSIYPRIFLRVFIVYRLLVGFLYV